MGFRFSKSDLQRLGAAERLVESIPGARVSKTVEQSIADNLTSCKRKTPIVGPPPGFTFLVKLLTVNESNGSMGNSKWAAIKKSERHKAEREAALFDAAQAMNEAGVDKEWVQGGDWKTTVVLSRLTSSRGMDDDGIANACKRVRDSVAKALGFDDDKQSSRLAWVYENQKARRGVHGVIVKVRFD